jgi:hypothetical protein
MLVSTRRPSTRRTPAACRAATAGTPTTRNPADLSRATSAAYPVRRLNQPVPDSRSVTDGSWNNAPPASTTYTYQWDRGDPPTPIGGADAENLHASSCRPGLTIGSYRHCDQQRRPECRASDDGPVNSIGRTAGSGQHVGTTDHRHASGKSDCVCLKQVVDEPRNIYDLYLSMD